MNTVNVMHLVDSLNLGGTERMAVNLANEMPRDRYRMHLCATRQAGPLANFVAEDVFQLNLDRKWRFDTSALRRLVAFNQGHGVQLLHAHGSSLFTAALSALFPPYPKVVWHIHFGRYAFERHINWSYRVLARQVAAVVTASRPLASWARAHLPLQHDSIHYLPNFVCAPQVEESATLPGCPGMRIVCVANLRPEKSHPVLLRAVAELTRYESDAHLLLVGDRIDHEYSCQVERVVQQLGLAQHVSFLGQRNDVAAVLRGCDVAVCSSAYEGLPLSILEYGQAGLPVVSTRVGQCADVLDEGRAGVLVPPNDPQAISTALLEMLRSSRLRAALGGRLSERVEQRYGVRGATDTIDQIYRDVLDA